MQQLLRTANRSWQRNGVPSDRVSAPVLAPDPIASSPSDDAEQRAYVRRNLRRTAIFVAVFFCTMLAGSLWFDEQLRSFTQWVFRTGDVWGLGLLIVLADSITSPIPPDFVLLVVATTPLKHNALWLIPLGGLLSSLAGVLGWYLGHTAASHRRIAARLANFSARHGVAVAKYGRLTVALGALTPLPFSITCWSAGALGMPLRQFFPMSLLRLPRYVVFYLLIVYAKQLSQWLGS